MRGDLTQACHLGGWQDASVTKEEEGEQDGEVISGLIPDWTTVTPGPSPTKRELCRRPG